MLILRLDKEFELARHIYLYDSEVILLKYCRAGIIESFNYKF